MAEITQVNLDANFQPAAAGANQAPTLAPVRDAIGLKTETAPAGDTTPNVGLNGRLQRIAQNVTALISSAASQIPAGTQNIGHVGGVEYEAVAANLTNSPLGATGAIGDYLSHLTVIPATTAPGAVSIKDGANTAIVVFAGGTLGSVIPFAIPIGAKSVVGAWQVTTGANVSVIGVGDFT